MTLSTADGSATFAGSVTINGNLSVPNGSIGNAALQNPISPLATHAGANSFGLATGANVQLLSTTISVPAGFTQALVFATATLHAYNNNAGADDAYESVFINGTSVGASSQVTAAAGASTSLPASGTLLVTGLGASFAVVVKCSSGANAWASSANNFINLDVMTIFLR
ncbi:hypothetical protein [Pseudarthrobacter sp. S9]|uniref:hypothetical protein n=1 Tax=Pseudarthrobacter sp. S9 TaxID=3418421 RepID=UPI003CFC4101